LNKDLLPTAKNLLEERSQADPKFQSTIIFTRMTGEFFRKALAEQLQIDPMDLPSARTNRRMLNRNGYALRPVRIAIGARRIAIRARHLSLPIPGSVRVSSRRDFSH